MGRVVLLAALVLGVASCTYGSDPPRAPAAAPPPPGPTVPGPVEPVPVGEGDDTVWRLVAGRGPTGDISVGDRLLTLTVGARRFGGFGGCNRFGMRARIDGERVRVLRPVTSTLIGCEDEILAAEEAYTSALLQVTRIERSLGRLVLSGPGARLEFVPCARPACETLEAGRR